MARPHRRALTFLGSGSAAPRSARRNRHRVSLRACQTESRRSKGQVRARARCRPIARLIPLWSRYCVLVRLDCVCHARSRRTGRSSDGAETQSVFSRQSDERWRGSDTHSVHARHRGSPCARDLRNRLPVWPMVWVDVATAANQARSQGGSEAQGASIEGTANRPDGDDAIDASARAALISQHADFRLPARPGAWLTCLERPSVGTSPDALQTDCWAYLRMFQSRYCMCRIRGRPALLNGPHS